MLKPIPIKAPIIIKMPERVFSFLAMAKLIDFMVGVFFIVKSK